MPSARFQTQRGIWPAGLGAFDAHKAKPKVNQQVSSFPRQDDGERSSLPHDPITHPPELRFPFQFLGKRRALQNIPKVFEFRQEADRAARARQRAEQESGSTRALPVPHPLAAPGPSPAQEELLQAPTRGAFVPESKVTTT